MLQALTLKASDKKPVMLLESCRTDVGKKVVALHTAPLAGTTDLHYRLPPAQPRQGPGTADHMLNLGRGHVQAAPAGPGGGHRLPALGRHRRCHQRIKL